MHGLYERVSSNGQEFHSQEPELRAWAKNQKERSRWYRDKFTGTAMDRPGLDKLMDQVRRGDIKTVVVWRLDRLGRTAKGLHDLIDELRVLGVRFISLREGFDLSTPAGRLMLGVLASCAQFETEVRRERQVAGIAAARARGIRWGGRRPGTRVRLTEEKETTIRRLRAAGQPVAQIARVVGLTRKTVYRALDAQ